MKLLPGVLCAVLITAFPLFAGAQSSPAPANAALTADTLEITSCSVEYGADRGTLAKLHVSFINHAAQPITKIRFGLRVDDFPNTIPVIDLGNFAPGLTIHHDLDPPMTMIPTTSRNLDCFVDAFTLKDGSTWISPELQAQMQSQQP